MLDLDLERQACTRLSEFVERYVDTRRGELKSHRAMELTLNRMMTMLPDVPLPELRRNDIAQYVVGRRKAGAANGTINCELLTLSAAINYARNRWDWQITNPVPGQYVKWSPGRLRYLERPEKQQLINAAGDVSKRGAHVLPDFLYVAINTGMRKNEMMHLTWDRVRLEAGSIVLTADDTKNSRPRVVPLNKEAKAAIESRRRYRNRYCRGSRWVFADRSGERVKSIHAAFVEARERAKIEDFRIHDLRHTFASWLVMEGVSLYVVRDLLGHSSIKMTERYAHLAQTALVQAVAMLDGK
ncbi:MAG: bacteriophage integrase [Rhodocyclaceae bacterium]|nr:MAG: bacteriophage integrase [Rhodocyclaceae bacterium]TND01884.1 MAG: bacteriophage integrase [Rhodocyclaceae bacterium]